MMDLIEYCARHNIDGNLDLPDIKRTDLYFKYEMNLKNN